MWKVLIIWVCAFLLVAASGFKLAYNTSSNAIDLKVVYDGFRIENLTCGGLPIYTKIYHCDSFECSLIPNLSPCMVYSVNTKVVNLESNDSFNHVENILTIPSNVVLQIVPDLSVINIEVNLAHANCFDSISVVVDNSSQIWYKPDNLSSWLAMPDLTPCTNYNVTVYINHQIGQFEVYSGRIKTASPQYTDAKYISYDYATSILRWPNFVADRTIKYLIILKPLDSLDSKPQQRYTIMNEYQLDFLDGCSKYLISIKSVDYPESYKTISIFTKYKKPSPMAKFNTFLMNWSEIIKNRACIGYYETIIEPAASNNMDHSSTLNYKPCNDGYNIYICQIARSCAKYTIYRTHAPNSHVSYNHLLTMIVGNILKHNQPRFREYAVRLNNCSIQFIARQLESHTFINKTMISSKPDVNGKWKDKRLPNNSTAPLEHWKEFECSILSEEAVNIERFKIRAQINGQTSKADSEPQEILRLDNIKFEEDGWVSCYVVNSLGQSTALAFFGIAIKDRPLEPTTIALYSLGLFVSLLMIFTLGLMMVVTIKLIIRKLNRKGKNDELLMEPETERDRSNERPDSNDMTSSQTVESISEILIDIDWEIPRSKLIIGSVLGEGGFGCVMMAEMLEHDIKTTVAVKTLKDDHTDQDVSDLISEIKLMKKLGKHINIINLLGCCTQNGPIYIIVEYALHGNLRDFLRSNHLNQDYFTNLPTLKTYLTEKDLVSYACQAARGMEYLASKQCIHRDLAARNVLVAKDFIIKIADFGLARNVYDRNYYKKSTDGRLPIKWMAPETFIYQKYDVKSDVWSFGVLLWEIMSLGATPYPYIVKYTKLISALNSGYRMERPTNCLMTIYSLMLECWNLLPTQRPYFSHIVERLDDILSEANDTQCVTSNLSNLETPPTSETISDIEPEEQYCTMTPVPTI